MAYGSRSRERVRIAVQRNRRKRLGESRIVFFAPIKEGLYLRKCLVLTYIVLQGISGLPFLPTLCPRFKVNEQGPCPLLGTGLVVCANRRAYFGL